MKTTKRALTVKAAKATADMLDKVHSDCILLAFDHKGLRAEELAVMSGHKEENVRAWIQWLKVWRGAVYDSQRGLSFPE